MLFLGSVLGILYYLLRSSLWEITFNPVALLTRAVVLLPISLFFASLCTLILWYLLSILLPGIFRYRRLRLLRYRRSLRRSV
jgi:hypothetical protein